MGAFNSKFFVLKTQDILDYLTEAEQMVLLELSKKIMLGRTIDGKKINSYIVVNDDEEYAMIVSELIAIGEAEKHRKQNYDIMYGREKKEGKN